MLGRRWGGVGGGDGLRVETPKLLRVDRFLSFLQACLLGGKAPRSCTWPHISHPPQIASPASACVHAAERDVSLPRVASLQNAYSLTCRTFDAHLAEACHAERVSLLAYSPLAMGLLTVRLPAGLLGPFVSALFLWVGLAHCEAAG